MSQELLNDNTDSADREEPESTEVEEAADRIGETYYPVEFSISSYGADYTVDEVFSRIKQGRILIPNFRAGDVWNRYRASRFIELLLIGLPIPSVTFLMEPDSGKLLVVDGRRRLRTLEYFRDERFPPRDTPFALVGVQERYQGKTYRTLHELDRMRLDESLLHAIVVAQESSDAGKPPGLAASTAYHIFERLDAGGGPLHPQEIRSCVFHGPFIDMLETLNDDPSWRALFGPSSERLRDRELILRFLALRWDAAAYRKPMKEFLNRFTAVRRNAAPPLREEFSRAFRAAVATVRTMLGTHAFRVADTTNAALYDAVMIGVSERLDRGPITDAGELKAAYETLRRDAGFAAAMASGTTDESQVARRLEAAVRHFGSVP